MVLLKQLYGMFRQILQLTTNNLFDRKKTGSECFAIFHYFLRLVNKN